MIALRLFGYAVGAIFAAGAIFGIFCMAAAWWVAERVRRRERTALSAEAFLAYVENMAVLVHAAHHADMRCTWDACAVYTCKMARQFAERVRAGRGSGPSVTPAADSATGSAPGAPSAKGSIDPHVAEPSWALALTCNGRGVGWLYDEKARVWRWRDQETRH